METDANAFPAKWMKKKILLVDDDGLNLEVLEFLLRWRGLHNILKATNGVQALQMYCESNPIDLIISDVNMPEMCGDELFLKLKIMYPNVCMILCSGNPDLDVSHLRAAGLHAFIPKPYTPDILEGAIRNAFLTG